MFPDRVDKSSSHSFPVSDIFNRLLCGHSIVVDADLITFCYSLSWIPALLEGGTAAVSQYFMLDLKRTAVRRESMILRLARKDSAISISILFVTAVQRQEGQSKAVIADVWSAASGLRHGKIRSYVRHSSSIDEHH